MPYSIFLVMVFILKLAVWNKTSEKETLVKIVERSIITINKVKVKQAAAPEEQLIF